MKLDDLQNEKIAVFVDRKQFKQVIKECIRRGIELLVKPNEYVKSFDENKSELFSLSQKCLLHDTEDDYKYLEFRMVKFSDIDEFKTDEKPVSSSLFKIVETRNVCEVIAKVGDIYTKDELLKGWNNTLKNWDYSLEQLNDLLEYFGFKFEEITPDETSISNDENYASSHKKEDNMYYKKEDLKLFDVVELRNGWLMLVIEHDEEMFFSGLDKPEHCGLNYYDSLLKDYYDRDLEPIKIYRPTGSYSLRNLIVNKSLEDYKLIWKEDITKEITMQEIADKFGVDVKDLKIKK